MANPGNTGKRYRFRLIEQALVSGRGGVTFILSCGHRLPSYEPRIPNDYRWTQKAANRCIGERQACMQCGAEQRGRDA